MYLIHQNSKFHSALWGVQVSWNKTHEKTSMRGDWVQTECVCYKDCSSTSRWQILLHCYLRIPNAIIIFELRAAADAFGETSRTSEGQDVETRHLKAESVWDTNHLWYTLWYLFLINITYFSVIFRACSRLLMVQSCGYMGELLIL